MIIINWSDDYLISIIFYIFLIILCLTVVALLIIRCVRSVKRTAWSKEAVLICYCALIPLMITVFVSYYLAFPLIKYDAQCRLEKYEVVSGSFEIDSVIRNDYRDEELYNIVFTVDDVCIDGINAFTLEEKEALISNLDRSIEVRYGYVGEDIYIYQILILSQ